MNKKKTILIFVIIIILFITGYIKIQRDILLRLDKQLVNNIHSHYNKYVITNKEANIYNVDGNVIGKINDNIELSLDMVKIDKDTKYFKVLDIDNSYIKYEDVDKIDEISNIDNRYKNYIVFNKNVKTKDKTVFYDENNKYIYEVNSSYDFPIIILDSNRYGIEFNNRLLYILKEDIDYEYDNHNTDLVNTKGVPVFNYHFFYDDTKSDREGCWEAICHSKKQFKSHLDYFKENNILTLRMKELDLYLDNKIQLPTSVVITIDDGGRTDLAFDMLEEYKMNGTIFLVTSWYAPNNFRENEFIELHSHGHDLHRGGVCSGGQGGAIKCLDKDKLLADLKTSRELLNNSTYFCYPFYEYNQYAINALKEAGFTMAFAGELGVQIARPGVDKFKIPRFVVINATTLQDIKELYRKV